MPDDDTIQRFTALVRAHDLTYQYSDDWRAYRAGAASEAAIKQLAAQLPAGEAAKIWNAEVDRKVAEDFRDSFYWR